MPVVTKAELVMADGKSLERTGVTPDVKVLPTALDLANQRAPCSHAPQVLQE